MWIRLSVTAYMCVLKWWCMVCFFDYLLTSDMIGIVRDGHGFTTACMLAYRDAWFMVMYCVLVYMCVCDVHIL